MLVDHFVGLVRDFLSLVDRAATMPAHAFLEECTRMLPRLYAGGLELPDIEPSDQLVDYEVRSTIGTLTRLLGRCDKYWEVFDPCVEDSPVLGSLSDDLTDIYRDLAEPLLAYEAGRTADAIWQWKFNVRGHCGDHLVDALRVIHRLVNDHMPPDFVAEP